jgi:hypothetical protein
MNLLRSIATTAAVAAASCVLHAAAPLQPLRARCTVGASEHPGKFRLSIDRDECDGDHCGSSFSNEMSSRLTGVTVADLAEEGAHLTAALNAEAGSFTCAGTVHDGSLRGDSTFTPDASFVSRMEAMGFSGFDANKLQAYAFVNVESAWARSIQQLGIRDITTDNLIALRIFNVDVAYVHAITALGYELPSADKLIALRVQGVDPTEVREIRALGYQPTLDELIQIRIFHITPEFIRRMQARNLKDLTIAKLVQIRIFKLAD